MFSISSVSIITLPVAAQTSSWIKQWLWLHLCFHPDLGGYESADRSYRSCTPRHLFSHPDEQAPSKKHLVLPAYHLASYILTNFHLFLCLLLLTLTTQYRLQFLCQTFNGHVLTLSMGWLWSFTGKRCCSNLPNMQKLKKKVRKKNSMLSSMFVCCERLQRSSYVYPLIGNLYWSWQSVCSRFVCLYLVCVSAWSQSVIQMLAFLFLPAAAVGHWPHLGGFLVLVLVEFSLRWFFFSPFLWLNATRTHWSSKKRQMDSKIHLSCGRPSSSH